MIRVLQCVNNMHRAGLETVLMNYYRHIDRTKIQFDFLTHRPERSDYDDEIEALGGKVYYAPRLYPQNYPAYFAFMRAFYRDHPEYRIVHSHIDAMSYLPLLAAKKAGVPVRIAHSHSTSIDRDLKYPLKQCFRFLLPGAATHMCSCGEQAGLFLFRKSRFDILPNAIDPMVFRFDEDVRAIKRKELNIGDRFVVGHVGRFSYPKNHLFLLRIFSELLSSVPDSLLMLVGSGEKEEEIRQNVRALGLEDKVLFLGSRSDTAQLYQAMDAFVLPSLFEGVPVVGIEAQFAALPCFFSEKVPREVAFTNRCKFMSLDLPCEKWAEQIAAERKNSRVNLQILDNGFDIRTAHIRLMEYYLKLSRELSEKELAM